MYVCIYIYTYIYICMDVLWMGQRNLNHQLIDGKHPSIFLFFGFQPWNIMTIHEISVFSVGLDILLWLLFQLVMLEIMETHAALEPWSFGELVSAPFPSAIWSPGIGKLRLMTLPLLPHWNKGNKSLEQESTVRFFRWDDHFDARSPVLTFRSISHWWLFPIFSQTAIILNPMAAGPNDPNSTNWSIRRPMLCTALATCWGEQGTTAVGVIWWRKGLEVLEMVGKRLVFKGQDWIGMVWIILYIHS